MIENFDLDNKINELCNSSKRKVIKLQSSGTSKNVRRIYKFGYCPEVIRYLENIVKYKHYPYKIVNFISGDLKVVGGYNSVFFNESNNNFTYNIKHKKEIINFLNKFDYPIAINALPNEIFSLFQDTDIYETMLDMCQSGIVKTIKTTAWISFYKKKEIQKYTHLNDNMFNWISGLNFFTCQHNTKHFLPTFTTTRDGLKNKYNKAANYVCNSDYFKIKDNYKKCECGLDYQEFDFISNYENTKFAIGNWEDLAEELNSKFINLQFVKTNDENIDCLFFLQPNSEISERDRFLIENYFKNYKINYINNHFCTNGFNKYLPFWDNTAGNAKEYSNFYDFKLKEYPKEELKEYKIKKHLL